MDGIELGSLNGQITISDLYASGYFGSELSTEIGPSILINPSLELHGSDYLPNNTELYPAYPNPFNPVVKIPFDLNRESMVELSLFNLQGKRVKELMPAQMMNPGKYVINWDGSSFPSGMYFYTIRAGKFFQTEKLILLK